MLFHKAFGFCWQFASQRSFTVALCIVVFGVSIAQYKRFAPDRIACLPRDRSEHLGGEYYLIALSISRGAGFSDPFGIESGPTAWMPPVLPILLAILVLVLDSRQLVVSCIIGFQAMVLVNGTYIVLSEAERLRRPGIGFLVVVAGLMANFHEMFQKTHDKWLLMLVVSLMWQIGSKVEWCSRNEWYFVSLIWGILGGFAALCSPVLAGTWGCLILFLRTCYWKSRAVIGVVTAIAVAGLIVSPWVIRNRIVLGAWIPIKSNAGFELWQSQCADDDGVLDIRTLGSHPWSSGLDLKLMHAEVGEIEFVQVHRNLAFEDIVANPWKFSQRVYNRWYAAFISTAPQYSVDPSVRWLLELKRAIAWIPFFCLILLVTGVVKPPVGLQAIMLIYFCTVMPYVLISYYDRYGTPLLFVKASIVLFVLKEVLDLSAGPCRASIRNSARLE